MTRVLLVLFCTLVTTWQYVTVSLAACAPTCLENFEAITTASRGAPFDYRILLPHALKPFGITPVTVTAYTLLGFALFYALLGVWARRWRLNPVVALPLIALAISTMLPTWWGSLYTVLEWDLWLLALLCLPPWSPSPR